MPAENSSTDWLMEIVSMRGSVCAGDDMIVTGRVTRKYVEEGEHLVDLEITIATHEGPVTPCTATLALPSRGGAGSEAQ